MCISKVNGHFYAYSRQSKWDKAARRVKSTAEYLGVVLPDGRFVPKAAGQKDFYGRESMDPEGPIGADTDETDRLIIKNLSMNAKMPLSMLSKKAGIPKSTSSYRISAMGRSLGIRYVPEIDLERLGYIQYLVFVKFESSKPDIGRLAAEFAREPRVLAAFATIGRCDIVICMACESNMELISSIGDLRSCAGLAGYNARWNVSPFYRSYGFVQPRDNFFEMVHRRVWRRTRDAPRPTGNQMLRSEYLTLRELNRDGSAAFVDMDRRNALPRGTSQRAYLKLRDRSILKRITISMDKPQVKYVGIIIAEVINQAKFNDTRNALFKYVTKESGGITNRFNLVGDIEAPDGAVFFAPISSENEMAALEKELTASVHGIEVNSLVITSNIVGGFCHRLFDNNYSEQARMLNNGNRPQSEVY